jgi:hypothetical protein
MRKICVTITPRVTTTVVLRTGVTGAKGEKGDTGQAGATPSSTDVLPEGLTNLYFTAARAISALASTLSGYVTTAAFTWANLTGKPTFSTVATSGSYADLSNKPTIPTPTTDASLLTSGTLADARLSSNVSLDNINNNFSASQTFAGSANTAPNQTAASGSSLMTRDLVDARLFSKAQMNQISMPAMSGASLNGGFGATGIIGASLFTTATTGAQQRYIITNSEDIGLILPGTSASGYSIASNNGSPIDFSKTIVAGFNYLSTQSNTTQRFRFVLGRPGRNVAAANTLGGLLGRGIILNLSRSGTNTISARLGYQNSATATITNATNASPIVVTTADNHGLATGDLVEIQGVLGNTATNGTWTITSVSATSFSLDSSSGNGAWATSSASWQKLSSTVDTSLSALTYYRLFLVASQGSVLLYVNDLDSSPILTFSGFNNTLMANLGQLAFGIENTGTVACGDLISNIRLGIL